jgi:hypothetical protein
MRLGRSAVALILAAGMLAERQEFLRAGTAMDRDGSLIEPCRGLRRVDYLQFARTELATDEHRLWRMVVAMTRVSFAMLVPVVVGMRMIVAATLLVAMRVWVVMVLVGMVMIMRMVMTMPPLFIPMGMRVIVPVTFLVAVRMGMRVVVTMTGVTGDGRLQSLGRREA